MSKLLFEIPLFFVLFNFLVYLIFYLQCIFSDGYIKKALNLINRLIPFEYLFYSAIASILAIILTVIFFAYKKISPTICATTIILNILYIGACFYWIVRQ